MIIDCHAHLVPQSWFHPKSPKWMFDLPHLFDEQDKSGVDITVFGNNWIRSPDGYDPLKVVQEFNVHAAELTAKHPKRLLGLACSVPYDSGPILKETEKAIREYKLKGIMINYKHRRRVPRLAAGDTVFRDGQRSECSRLRPSTEIHHR